jgi:hypothetical protein
MGLRRLLVRRTGALGIALTAYDVWRRLPPKQRKAILKQARRHGPMVVKQARKHGPAVARIVAKNRKRP